MILDLLSLIALIVLVLFVFKCLFIDARKSQSPQSSSKEPNHQPAIVKQRQEKQQKNQEQNSFQDKSENPSKDKNYLPKQEGVYDKLELKSPQPQSNTEYKEQIENSQSERKYEIQVSQVMAEQKINEGNNELLKEREQQILPHNDSLIKSQNISQHQNISPNIINQDDPLLQKFSPQKCQSYYKQASVNNEQQKQRQQFSYGQRYQVKDVISECENYVPQEIHQIHSNAQRIQITQSPLKINTKRLKAVKEHYRAIIKKLKHKLDDICIQHNLSIQSIDLSQTITFSQKQSAYLQDFTGGNLEVKVQEVTNLKNQLQLHQQILTNIIEEDSKLKDKVRSLQQQNKQLKTALSSSQYRESQSQKQNSSLMQVENIHNLEEPKADHAQQQELKRSRAVESKIIQMYTSQIIANSPKSQILQSQILPSSKSTMPIMSLIFQGALSFGLFGECRFLNEISKKFVIGQIKKCLKKKVIDAELLYMFGQSQQQSDRSIYSYVKGRKGILLLMKLVNQRNIAIFVELIQSQQQECNQLLERQNILLLELSKKKSYSSQGYGYYQSNHIAFGQANLCLSEFAPHKLKKMREQNNLLLIEDEEVSYLAIYQLQFHNND